MRLRVGAACCLLLSVMVLLLPAIVASQAPPPPPPLPSPPGTEPPGTEPPPSLPPETEPDPETTLILNSVGTFNGEAAPEQAGPQTSFAPGEAIRYAVRIKNTGSSTVTASLDYLVTGPKEIYSLIDDIDIPPDPPEGGWNLYVTTTVPTDAPSGTYTLRVTMTVNGQSSTKESSFTVLRGSEQPPAAISRMPEGKAPNLVVLVHGCCTNENHVQEWDALAGEITQNTSVKSEVVVLDWHEDTPTEGVDRFGKAYIKAYDRGNKLGENIAEHPYTYVHLIGHSTGARLIWRAAITLAIKTVSSNKPKEEWPFIHLTFLDAFQPYNDDYGNLYEYPKYYSEHYVDRTDDPLIGPWTNSCLSNAFNFDITGWQTNNPEEKRDSGHHWPRYWYQKSITSTAPEFKYGFPFSLEGRGEDINELINEQAMYNAGLQCSLSDTGTVCEPAECW